MSLGKYLAEIIIEPTPKKVALYPGAFKPPHKGHFELVQRLSKVSDEVLVIISPIARDGITAEQSLSAWKLYLPLLPKAKVVISNVSSPVSYVYDYVKSNPQQDIQVAFGKDEGERYKAFLNKEKYPNVKVYNAGNIGGLSASSLRAAIKSSNPVDIAKFLPQGIEVNDFLNALKLSPRTEPTFNSINENISDPDFTNALASITKHYVDNGYNVKPLPKVKIISNDKANASNMLGKTAYYDPTNKSITLFTAGRHPKDILRSFSHEMIHHIQNLENRLNNITTTNTTEDDYLSQLEQEAYLNGNMNFRNWEDGIKNKVMNEQQTTNKYRIFCDMDGVLVDFDKGYEDLTGLHTKHVDVQDSNEFWNKFREGLKEKNIGELEYWSRLDWMSDGKELWNYIKQYNPYVLTAPSRDPQSREGKRAWVERLDNMKNIYFKAAAFKSEYAAPNRILIDDRADTIEKWNKNGGIGILHTSTSNTIEQLKKLGL